MADPTAQPRAARAVAAIGVFDGVHRGHQFLLRDVAERAVEVDARSVAVTFDPDPQAVLRPGAPAAALCSLEERVALIRALGLDEVFVWPFTPQVAAMSPSEFVAALRDRYGLCEVWVGENFAFGQGRRGTVATLTELGEQHGFGVHSVAPVYEGAQPISSSRIRELLLAGEVRDAAHLLGRPYRLGGEVVTGAERGRQLGFPTANLIPPVGRVLPAYGVYAGHAIEGGRAYPAVANVGSRPTFGEEQPLIEVHLLDYSGDLYGRELAFEFVERVRPIQRFASVDELRAQIQADIASARVRLDESDGTDAPAS